VKIEDQFRVDVPVEDAWKVLLDVERIAPCLPGAQLQEIDGDEYRGIVKVKVGPITAQYKGVARITEADEANHRVVLKAEGRDTRGQGNASAVVTATLASEGAGTVVKIDTDLNITGKVAQFGRGVMADVSSKLLGQFADNLQRDVLSGGGSADLSANATATESPPSSAASSTGPRRVDSAEPEPVDLMDAAGGAVGKRLIPVIVGVVTLVALRSFLKRRKNRKKKRAIRDRND
jgi:carbon monoxide dehydrogenase subunit G